MDDNLFNSLPSTELIEVVHSPIEATSAVVVPTGQIPGTAELATQIYIEDLRKRADAARDQSASNAKSLRRKENAIFGAMMITGYLAVVLIVLGVVLAFTAGLPFTLISEAVGLLSAGGSRIFRKLGNETKQEREVIEQRESDEARLLRALAVTSMIENKEQKDKTIADLAAKLADDVTRKAPK